MTTPEILTNDVDSGVVSGNISKNDESWEVKIDTIHDCSKAPSEMVVKVDLLAKMKIDSLMEEYPNIEWLAYLIGRRNEDGSLNPCYIVDIHIPDQEVTSTRVDKIECPEFNSLGVVGVIHSHHGMGTGFSGTDHAYINGNHNLSLVIAKNGVAGQYRWTTPCGALKIIDNVKVKVVYPQIGFDKKEWLKAETEKIKKYSPPQNIYTYPNYQDGMGYGYGYGWQGNKNKHLNPAQQKYNTGVSVKTAAKENGMTVDNDDDIFDTGITPTSDDAPKYDDMQSLEDALNEAFGV